MDEEKGSINNKNNATIENSSLNEITKNDQKAGGEVKISKTLLSTINTLDL